MADARMQGETRRQRVRVRKDEDGLVVTLPSETVDELGLQDGDLVELEITSLGIRPRLQPELTEAAEASWRRNEEAYRYLAEN
jgi:antitoxin component of MazEF toxin-antitoxin module